jgi:hypothetical protein
MAVRRNSLYLCRKLVSFDSIAVIIENGDDETAWELAVRLGRSPRIIAAVT